MLHSIPIKSECPGGRSQAFKKDIKVVPSTAVWELLPLSEENEKYIMGS